MMDDELFSTEFSDRVAIAVPEQVISMTYLLQLHIPVDSNTHSLLLYVCMQVSRVSFYSDQDHTDTKGKLVALEMEPTCYISDDVCLHQQPGFVCLPQGGCCGLFHYVVPQWHLQLSHPQNRVQRKHTCSWGVTQLISQHKYKNVFTSII